jgi:hypothetical protein
MGPNARTDGPAVRRSSRAAVILAPIAVIAVALPFAFECFTIIVNPGHGPIYSWGDQAFLSIATKTAAGWQQLLGPYDRFGWHHPGPTYFYLQSLPFHSLASGQTLFFGASTINALAAMMCVATVWRRIGYRAAMWAGICVVYLAIALGPDLLRNPWNPYVVIMPMCLLVILCGSSASGSWLSLLGSLLIGSYLVQTDVGTAPAVVVLLLTALAVLLILRRRWPAGARPMPLARGRLRIALTGLGAAALVAMWVPPLIQQVTGRPGNLTLLWSFFTAGHPRHSVGEAVHAVGAINARLTFRSLDVLAVAPGSYDVAVYAGLAASVVAVAVALRRRHRFALGLGVMALVGQLASIAAVTRVVGPIGTYLVLWEIALPVVAVLALGLAIFGHGERPTVGVRDGSPWTGVVVRHGLEVGLAIGTIVAASVFTVRVGQLPPISTFSAVAAGQAWEMVSPQLRSADTSVLVDLGSPASWPLGAGLADALDQHGVNPAVPKNWAFLFGTDTATGREPAVVTLYERADAPPTPPPGSHYLGIAGNTLVFFTQRAPTS